MELDELKKSMSTLDDLLAEKTVNTLNFDTATCDTAQNRIMKHYRKGAFSSIILAVVFFLTCNATPEQEAFPTIYKLFLAIFLATAALWYGFLYLKTSRIRIAVSTPLQTLKQAASLRLCALTGEIVLGMVMVVFFTLFLANLWNVKQHVFWITIAAIVVSLIIAVTIYLPRLIRDFKNLTATE